MAAEPFLHPAGCDRPFGRPQRGQHQRLQLALPTPSRNTRHPADLPLTVPSY
ncbi:MULTISPECIES: hypothetical protein [Streptomyces]|uniref:Uncharacterized protein n=1 Tax=Streptomyces sp. 900129855 TaxID=3155129 RepID=A0ABV2ZYZ2_9ACTN